MSIAKGRSVCPKCREKIVWYDNFPLLSFLLLRGRCRQCRKLISWRYPLIEAGTAAGCLLVYTFGHGYPLVLLVVVFFLTLAVTVVDLEHQLILDQLVFGGYLVAVGYLVLSGNHQLYSRLLGGFLCSLFFLGLNLITKGRGMGLGDVKLAILLGTLLQPLDIVIWLGLSFVLGAVVGVVLLIFGRAGLKTKIAFGPFMVVAFWLVVFWGEGIIKFIVW